MTDPDPLAALLAEALTAAQYRYRSRLGTWGAAVSQPAPAALIDALAVELAPVFRVAAREAERESTR
jgi:hypothetical protein